MGKKTEIAGTADEVMNVLDRASKRAKQEANATELEIKSAQLKDDFCNYTYEFTSGVGAGDSVSRKGAAIVHDHMKVAFKKLNVHLAVICEEIATDNIIDIEKLENIDLSVEQSEMTIEGKVATFHVSAFKLDSTGENENVVLIGSKRLSTGDYVELKSPKTNWHGDYPYINELRVAIDDCKSEVEEYMNGKAAPKLVQSEIQFGENGEQEEGGEE